MNMACSRMRKESRLELEGKGHVHNTAMQLSEDITHFLKVHKSACPTSLKSPGLFNIVKSYQVTIMHVLKGRNLNRQQVAFNCKSATKVLFYG